MNKTIIAVAGISLLVVASLAYVLLRPKNADVTSSQSTSQTQVSENTTAPEQSQTESNTEQLTPGIYTGYTKDALAAATGTKVLFFHAPWCPQCRELEDTINRNGVPSGVTVFKVDYDSNQGLRQKYGVTMQTTFVKVDSAGNKIKSYVAYQEPQFSSVEKNLLND